ncbi:MAG: hypothetical protein HKN09_00330 [Saprospiraceae bacterium]|nr:hypothetical protein [Saprospiraceae bacterium]
MEDHILYSSGKYGNSDILMMDANGHEILRVSDSAYEEWSPSWIDANTVSFLRQVNDKIKIIRHDLSTREETELPHPERCIIDDKNIQYSSVGNYKLFVCNGVIMLEQKTATKELTGKLNGTSNYTEWFGDNKVLFTNNGTGNNEIYLIDLTTNELTQLTDNPANDERASLSPDGNWMIFSSDRFEKGNQEILLKDLSNNTVINISNSQGTELIARWNHDGTKVFYGSNKDGNWELYSYNIKTKEDIRLTTHEAFDGDPRVFYR